MQKGQLVGEGRTAEIYAWGDDQVLRLYRHAVSVFSIEREASIGRVVLEAGLPAPAVGEWVELDGRRGVLYERIDGRSMLQEMTRRPWTLVRTARQFARLHTTMHSRDGAGLPSQQEQLRRRIEQVTQLAPAVKARVLARLESLPAGNAICHGDYHPDNILMSTRGPVVIDWMTASCGNPAADVARTALLFLDGSLPPGMKPLQRATIEGMRRLFYRLYLYWYRQYRPLSQIAVEIWLPILAAARLAEQIADEEERLLSRTVEAFG